jgi:hypothetical protein
MSCKSCKGHFFKEKLGRCRFCMWLNFFLLVSSSAGWLYLYQTAPKQVETIALLFTLIASGILMALHIGVYLYYRLQGIKHPTQDTPPRE